MTISKPALLGIATLLTLGLPTIPAQATALRTFLSSTGNDANTASNCAVTAPCRTLAAAFSVTQANGHIFILGAGGYGTLTITRSVTIVGVEGALIGVPSDGIGITINAGPNDNVGIRGLLIDGGAVGKTGIQFNTGASLIVADCVIRGLTTFGIDFKPNVSSPNTLAVSNTIVNNSGIGIIVIPTGSGLMTANLTRVELYNNSQGFSADGSLSTGGKINAVISDSVVADSALTGLAVGSTTGNALATLTVIRSVISHNDRGLSSAGLNATLRVSQSTLTGNTSSWGQFTGSTLRSYGDNNIDGNADGDPTPAPIVKK